MKIGEVELLASVRMKKHSKTPFADTDMYLSLHAITVIMSIRDDIEEVRHNTQLKKKSKHMKKAMNQWIERLMALEICYNHDEDTMADDEEDEDAKRTGTSKTQDQQTSKPEKKYYRGLSLYRFCKIWVRKIQPGPARETLLNPLVDLGFIKELEKTEGDTSYRYHITTAGKEFYLRVGKAYLEGYEGIYEGLLETPLAQKQAD